MHFEGEFSVPGRAEDVIRRFADVPRMSRCMPGAVLEPQAEDGSWPGAMVVAFGPKKISFKGRVTTAFDFEALTGSLHGRGAADMRAARIGVKVNFALRNDTAASVPTTLVKIVSDAELGGVLADFARAGGIAVANVIMADFAQRAAAEFANDETAVVEPTVAEPSPNPAIPSRDRIAEHASRDTIAEQRPPPAPLAAHTLLWAVVMAQFLRLGKWLRLIR